MLMGFKSSKEQGLGILFVQGVILWFTTLPVSAM